MKTFYTDYYDLLERFCIMTLEGGLSDIEAINRLRSQTTPELIEKLENYYIR